MHFLHMKTSSFLGGLLLIGVLTAGCGDDSGGGGGAGGDATTSSTTGATTGGTTSSTTTTTGSTSASTTSSSTGDGGATSSSSGDGGATSSSSGDGGAGGATSSSSGDGGGGGLPSSVTVVACGGADIAATIATQGLNYDPALVTIAPGDVIRFTPVGMHNMLADDLSWRSGELSETACLQFSEPGLFPYHCEFHGLGMAGTVTVE